MPDEIAPPRHTPPSEEWEHYRLWKIVQEVFQELPKHFTSTISVSGIRATEVYTFGAVLGVTIEEEVVRTLNDLRDDWDPDQRYVDYIFVRQPEAFPDVLLMNPNSSEIIMGIELKSWYLLAKEGEPSFRFTVTPNACAEQDLILVVPWALSNVLSGSPIVFAPFVELARYVAEYRNYWWQYVRKAEGSTEIQSPSEVRPYPRAREEMNDTPIEDKGKNFGRIARLGIMDDYVRNFESEILVGVKLSRWHKFFKAKNG